MFKQAVREAMIIVFSAAVLGLIVYGARPERIGGVPSAGGDPAAEQATAASGLSGTPAEMPREITLARAKQLFDDTDAIFADARHPADYAAGHIRGARNLYVGDPDQWLSGFLADTDPARVIVTYCDGEQCHLAPELAELLYFNGFDKVYYLTNGWTRWRSHGFPIALTAGE